MTLKQLAIRTKKSLTALHVLSNEHASSSTAAPPETPKKTPTSYTYSTPAKSTPEYPSPVLDEYASPSSHGSSKADTPSKRSRLRRSLQKMRSSFELMAKNKPSDKSSDETAPQDEQTPPARPRPSLMLNFEVSPPDQPMFDSGRNPSNSSAVNFRRSSPIAVPRTTESTSPMGQSFHVGTLPDSPAPLTKASVRRSILGRSMRFDKTRTANVPVADPLPTPMPGTNFALEIQPPEIVVSSPSAPSMKRMDGYFDITKLEPEPPVEQDSSVNEQTLNASARTSTECTATVTPIEFAVPPIDCTVRRVDCTTAQTDGTAVQADCTAVQTDCTAVQTDSTTSPTDCTSSPTDGNASQVDSGSSQTEYMSSPTDAKADGHLRVDSRSAATPDSDNDLYALDAEARKSLETKSDCVSMYLALESANAPANGHKKREGRRSIWGRHTGLYDGTGYAASDSIEDDRLSQMTAFRNEALQSQVTVLFDENSRTVETIPGTEGPEMQGKSEVLQVTTVEVKSVRPPTLYANDDKEELQDIVNAYALYDDTASDMNVDDDKENIDPMGGSMDKGKGRSLSPDLDIVLSQRIMDNTLGG